MLIDDAATIATAVAMRHAELTTLLRAMSVEELLAPSLLPGWTKLTVVCHLRYGAEANRAVTLDVLDGKRASYYPEGRSAQRPVTLVPRSDESPADVVDSLLAESAKLDELWRTLPTERWALEAREPDDNVDLGPTTLGFLALMRLTEVEVHGFDLDVGARPWSDVFVDTALPMRLRWLPERRSNHGAADTGIHATWVLRPSTGLAFALTASTDGVSVAEGVDLAGDVEIAGSKHDLLSFILGRTSAAQLEVTGDRELADAFHQAFPSP